MEELLNEVNKLITLRESSLAKLEYSERVFILITGYVKKQMGALPKKGEIIN